MCLHAQHFYSLSFSLISISDYFTVVTHYIHFSYKLLFIFQVVSYTSTSTHSLSFHVSLKSLAYSSTHIPNLPNNLNTHPQHNHQHAHTPNIHKSLNTQTLIPKSPINLKTTPNPNLPIININTHPQHKHRPQHTNIPTHISLNTHTLIPKSPTSLPCPSTLTHTPTYPSTSTHTHLSTPSSSISTHIVQLYFSLFFPALCPSFLSNQFFLSVLSDFPTLLSAALILYLVTAFFIPLSISLPLSPPLSICHVTASFSYLLSDFPSRSSTFVFGFSFVFNSKYCL